MEEDNKLTHNKHIEIGRHIPNLMHFWPVFNFSKEIELTGNLEITPLKKFKPEFGNIYWYFQYLLLKEGKVVIEKEDIIDEYKDFFLESEVNFEWVNLTDASNYQVKCIDGLWRIDACKIECIDLAISLLNGKL
jgi:hypothetical protein